MPENPEKVRLRKMRYRHNLKKYHPEKYRKYLAHRHEKYLKNRDRNREKGALYNQRKRLLTITILGGKCSQCGISDIRVLQIDHINGGGQHQRKHEGGYKRVTKEVLCDTENAKKKYQLLCANCNWIKRYENNEHNQFFKTGHH